MTWHNTAILNRPWLQRRQRRQRGFNLVEVGIILAVVGLLLGASLVPLGKIWKSEAYQSERDNMRAIQDAIAGYALTNSTRESQVEVTSNGVTIPYTIPAGRPYLPCPDVTGDGYEDRVDTADTYTIADTPLGDINTLLINGNCYLSRGILPWKTLGVPPADRWGNRYTYQVDDLFASAAVGFNQETVADVFDPRMTVQLNAGGGFSYQKRDLSFPSGGIVVNIRRPGLILVARSFQNKRRPIVICGADVAICTPLTGVPLRLDAGQIATGPFNAARRNYVENDVIEGAVYVIVSHGENGHGAVNHQLNRQIHKTNPSLLGVRCNDPFYSASAPAAQVNINAANYPHLLHETINLPFPELTLPIQIRYCPHVSVYNPGGGGGGSIAANNGFFINLARTDASVDQEFDDVLVWQMRAELFQTMTRARKLPVAELPLFRAY